MKKTRFSDEQIVRILQEADQATVAKAAKNHGGGKVNVDNL